MKRLREGVVEIATGGMLPEAEIAFLDEVFLGSTAILNGLLAVLNERTFRRGSTEVVCPLRMCIGASNALPDDETLAAFADRFLLRSFLRSLPETRIEELLEAGWSLDHEPKDAPKIDTKDLDAMTSRAKRVDLSPVRSSIAHAVRSLRKDGIVLSDRRTVRSQRVIAAAAALAGRDVASEADLWPLLYVVPTAEGQSMARETLRELLAKSESATLGAAAEDASSSTASRAARLVEEIAAALGAKPEAGELRKRWKTSLEGIAREVDAGFAKDAFPESLAAARARLVTAIDEPDAS